MSSMEELKAQALRAAELVDEATARINAASASILEATSLLQLTFEGSGNEELLQLSARTVEHNIALDDLMLGTMGTANGIRDAVVMM